MMPGFESEVVQELNFDSSDEGEVRSDDSAIGHNNSMESLVDFDVQVDDGGEERHKLDLLDIEAKAWKQRYSEEQEAKAWRQRFSEDVFPSIRCDSLTTSPPCKKLRGLVLNSKGVTTPRISRRRPALFSRDACSEPQQKRLLVPSCLGRNQNGKKETIAANVNPFTPNHERAPEIKINSCGRRRSNCSLSLTEEVLIEQENGQLMPLEKLSVSESNIFRYRKEFVQLDVVGSGEYGHVYKCLNRLDGSVYAIKRSAKPVAHKFEEKVAMSEVYAHAVLGVHPNIVRYFSAWAEEGHVCIQNEFCNGGSLSDLKPCELPEPQLRTILQHVTEGLRHIHSLGLVHLDIKPENVFLCRSMLSNSSQDANCSFKDEAPVDIVLTYKIGDLGHVTSTQNPQVEDGDCRYLAKELLDDNYTCLPKCDILALGLMIFELAGGGELPKNGAQWHQLRQHLPPLPSLSKEFNKLLQTMVSPNPDERPSAAEILNRLLPPSEESKEIAELKRKIHEEELKNKRLTKQLEKHSQNHVADNGKRSPMTRRCSSRVIGKNSDKSKSADMF